MKKIFVLSASVVILTLLGCNVAPLEGESTKTDPLPSWNDGINKKAIVDFVRRTTTEGSSQFIPIEDRIACFDNDGTLWSEQPYYFQLAFAIDRVKTMAPQHPEWKGKQPFQALIEGDLASALSGGEHAILEIVMASHAGMTTERFDSIAADWMKTSVHPTKGVRYAELVFQPMLELLQYLRDNQYKTFIVSGGGVDFLRVFTQEVYGIPSEQVIGSTIKLQFEDNNGKPLLRKLPKLDFIDDKAGKPIGIQRHIGKRPVIAVGNSDGDYEMLQYTTTTDGYSRMGIIVHHTDGEREWSYDRNSSVGKLSQGLDDANKFGWLVVDMKNDWNTIFNNNLNEK